MSLHEEIGQASTIVSPLDLQTESKIIALLETLDSNVDALLRIRKRTTELLDPWLATMRHESSCSEDDEEEEEAEEEEIKDLEEEEEEESSDDTGIYERASIEEDIEDETDTHQSQAPFSSAYDQEEEMEDAIEED